MFKELLGEITNTGVFTASLKGIWENLSANTVIMILMMIFCVVGGVDKLRGNKHGYGEKFEDAFGAMKSIALAMIGIITLVPVLKLLLEPIIAPIYAFFGASPAMFAGTLLPVDCGAYPLAMQLAEGDAAIGNFSGVVLGSTFGCLFIGNVPICLSVLDKKYYNLVAMAVLMTIITIPLGCIAGGLAMNFTPYKLPFMTILINLIPAIIIAALVALGLILKPQQVMRGFCAVGQGLQFILICSIIVATVQAVTGLRLPLLRLMVEPGAEGGVSPLTDSLIIVGNIALVLSGAFPMVLWISRKFKKPIQRASRMLGMNEAGGAGLIASLANIFPGLEPIPQMNEKARLLVITFCIAGSCVFGDHLGFTAGVCQDMILPMIVAKMVAAIGAMLLASLFAPKLLKEQ